MTHYQRDMLNVFFVRHFNTLVTYEEITLRHGGFHNLSIKDFHTLQAVFELKKRDENTMTNIANYLLLSVGALTTSINALVWKGYVKRAGSHADRRIVYIELTELGKNAVAYHESFHNEMIESAGEFLSDSELETLITSLTQLTVFFNTKLKENKKI